MKVLCSFCGAVISIRVFAWVLWWFGFKPSNWLCDDCCPDEKR